MLLAWAMVLLFTTTSCRDFEDAHTPYKSFVVVKFTPKNDKHTKLDITAINNTDPQKFSIGLLTYQLPLDPHADTTSFVIASTSPTSPDTLRITYRRIVSLISHKRGAQLELVLDQVHANFAEEVKILNNRLSTLNEIGPDVQIYF